MNEKDPLPVPPSPQAGEDAPPPAWEALLDAIEDGICVNRSIHALCAPTAPSPSNLYNLRAVW
ncbi:MAG: hypothetical protein JMDDDDMK_00067 [Acidobacteria bacterium]|nr:hypothetical protein [Acidobacteriota bacterium]